MNWRGHWGGLLAIVGFCAGMWVLLRSNADNSYPAVKMSRAQAGKQWKNRVRVAVVWPDSVEGDGAKPLFAKSWLADRIPNGPLMAAVKFLRKRPLPSYPEGLRLALNMLREKEILQNLDPLADRIELVRYDEPVEPASGDGFTVARKVVGDESVVAAVGHYSSPSAIEASIVYEKNKVLFITPTATMPELTKRGFFYTFRLTPDDGDLGQAIALFAKHSGYAKVGILYPRTAQGESLRKRLTVAAWSLGIEVACTKSYFAGLKEWDDMDDYRPLAAKLHEFNVNAFLMADELPRAAKLVRDFRSMELMQPILGSDYMDSSSLIQLAGVAAKDVYVTSSVNPDTKTAAYLVFKERFIKEFGALPSYAAAQGFETMQLLYNGIRRADSAEPLELANRFRTDKSWPSMFQTFRFDAEGTIECREISTKVTEVEQMRFSSLVTSGPEGIRLPFGYQPTKKPKTVCP